MRIGNDQSTGSVIAIFNSHAIIDPKLNLSDVAADAQLNQETDPNPDAFRLVTGIG